MSEQTISTFSRYLYLNSYAFLLLAMGTGIAFIPLYRISWWLLIPQALGAILCLKGAYSIFSSWEDKKRKYRMLMERNRTELRPDTFTEFMQAPCGRLLIRVVLTDLGRNDAYPTLKRLTQKPLRKRLQEGCKPQKTIIYMNENYLP